MKKFMLSAVASMIAFSVYGDIDVKSLSEFNEISLQEFMEGEHPEWAICLEKGEQFPIEITLDGDLALLKNTGEWFPYLEFQKTIYIRCTKDDLLVSVDTAKWDSINDFITGQIRFQVNLQENEPITLKLESEVNQNVE